ncbi:MAG: right-handed parallel beta-helix repeat-containing protein, partial [Thermocrispum sp.]
DSVMLSQSADALNLNGHATDVTVTNNYIRNTGDDSLAMWSLRSPNTGNTFSNNTIVQPNLANGIAIYGGTDMTIADNVIVDTNALGSGIALSNQEFLPGQGFTPLAGTMTVSGNTLIRTGAMNPNWNHPMSAIRIDSYDYPVQDVAVNLTDNEILQTRWSALQIVSGGGKGHPVTGLTVDGLTVDEVGTVVLQAEAPGSGTFTDVVATNVSVAGIYNCSYPPDKPDFTVNLGSGNSGWQDSEWEGCEFPDRE